MKEIDKQDETEPLVKRIPPALLPSKVVDPYLLLQEQN